MQEKIVAPYHSVILNHVWKCKICGRPLLMDGCGNVDCMAYRGKKTRLNKDFPYARERHAEEFKNLSIKLFEELKL